MDPAFAHLDSLVALITSAVNDAKSEYTKLNLTVPSLDDVEPHPLDSMAVPQKLKKAMEAVNGACAQLSTLLLPPQQALYLRTNDYLTSLCIQVTYESQVADLLKAHPDGLHVSQIASRTGIDEAKMARLLRLLATRQCFREVKEDVFANNRLSVLITRDAAVSTCVGFSLEEQLSGGIVMYETLTDKEASPSYAPDLTPFAKAHNGRTLWDYYRNENPSLGKRFMTAMTGFGEITSSPSMIRGFPWAELPKGSSVCDLGSGVGHISMEIARLNPDIRIVLQDQEETMRQGRVYWGSNEPEILNQGRVNFVVTDFFKESPVSGCDIYYVKHILHNWTDKACKTILANIKKAMKPTSRIIVQEYVMQHLSPSTEEEKEMLSIAPAPLPPSFGEGRLLPTYLDIAMMILFNSRERTLAEFKQLGAAVGLELVKVWDGGELSAVEYRLPVTST